MSVKFLLKCVMHPELRPVNKKTPARCANQLLTWSIILRLLIRAGAGKIWFDLIMNSSLLKDAVDWVILVINQWISELLLFFSEETDEAWHLTKESCHPLGDKCVIGSFTTKIIIIKKYKVSSIPSISPEVGETFSWGWHYRKAHCVPKNGNRSFSSVCECVE